MIKTLLKCPLSVLERCPSCREFCYSKMTEKRQGPSAGVRLIEVSVKRELTVFNNCYLLACKRVQMLNLNVESCNLCERQFLNLLSSWLSRVHQGYVPLQTMRVLEKCSVPHLLKAFYDRCQKEDERLHSYSHALRDLQTMTQKKSLKCSNNHHDLWIYFTLTPRCFIPQCLQRCHLLG